MPFPYLTPVSKWAREVLQSREAYTLSTVYKAPFIVITSGAKIIKAPAGGVEKDKEKRAIELDKIIRGELGGAVYDGCIIANSIGTNIDSKISENKDFIQNGGLANFSYSLGKTPVGIDFSGKVITAEESGRKVSMPIIEGMELDTDGANNTLKTAKVTVRCFTLKQLEMFELFFMKPGMNVLVEFGDNTLDIKKKLSGVSPKIAEPSMPAKDLKNVYQDGKGFSFNAYTSVTEALVPKSNYEKFCEDFSGYFRSGTKNVAEYLTAVRQSLGTYDRVAGKVLDYSFSVNEDGTYTATFDVSQGNQVSCAVPTKQPSKKAGDKNGGSKDPKLTDEQIIQNIMVADFGLDDGIFKDMLKTHPIKGKTWMDDWYNFLKVNEEQKDTATSTSAYVSLRFVLVILMNYIIPSTGNDPFFKLDLPKVKRKQSDPDDQALRIILCDNNPKLISSSPEVIIPRAKLPKPIAPTKEENKDQRIIEFADEDTMDGTINGYDFDTDIQSVWLPDSYYGDSPRKAFTQENKYYYGDALNLFLDYQKVVQYWNKSYTRTEFLSKILAMVNEASYGLWRLVYGLDVNSGPPVVMNYGLGSAAIQKSEGNEPVYRFKPTTINSIVKEFSFNFEMSDLVAGMTLFNTRKVLKQATKPPKPENKAEIDKLPIPPHAYKSVDNSLYANADGYYSINNVEYINLQRTKEQIKDEEAKKITTDPPNKDEATKEPPNYAEIIKGKSVLFKNPKDSKNPRILIFKNKEMVYEAIWNRDFELTKSVVSPIDISITIGGFSGLSTGEYFDIDGVPEIYNKSGVFQITNIKHSVKPEGWSTTIEAGHMVMNEIIK